MSEVKTKWHDSPLGKVLIESSLSCIQRLLPNKYYRVILQISGPPLDNYLTIVDAEVRCKISALSNSDQVTTVVAEPEWLPFAAKSTDLIVLPHSLEFSRDPHELLREVAGCVVSGGVVVVVGFNPKSMLGGLKFLGLYSDSTLHQAKLYSIQRVRDWLTLLGFEPIAGEYIFFRPPLTKASRLQRFKRMEIAGYRWWPSFGSLYILVVKKKDFAFQMNASELRNRSSKHRGVLQPIAENRNIVRRNTK